MWVPFYPVDVTLRSQILIQLFENIVRVTMRPGLAHLKKQKTTLKDFKIANLFLDLKDFGY